MKKIAFCFLIYDKINHEILWQLFFKNINPNVYNIYIHYKQNIPSIYFDKYKLKSCIATKYADISIVKAQNVLLNEALKDADNQHFVFLSNSCIPLKSFRQIYTNLDVNYSYFTILESQKGVFPRCDCVLNHISKEFIQKASQWCILNKKHAELLTKNTLYLKWFNNIYAPDEHCYISYIFYSNLQHEIIVPDSHRLPTTFTNWNENSSDKDFINGLKNYKSISANELIYLLESSHLFGRKFSKECVKTLLNYIYLKSITTNTITTNTITTNTTP